MDEEYRTHKIRYNQDHRFTVIGPHLDNQGSLGYDSYREACTAIDEAIATHVKSEERKLALPVIAPMGKIGKDRQVHRLRIKGIHAGNCEMLFLESFGDKSMPAEVYPDHPTIRMALEEIIELRTRIEAIEASIEPFEIMVRRGYGRVGKSLKMIDMIRVMETEWVEKTDAANKKYS